MKPVTLKKISAGNYEYTYPDGTIAVVYKGDVSDYGRLEQWTIKTLTASRADTISYSDPIRTRRDCVAAIQDKLDNPEKYGAQWAVKTTTDSKGDATWTCPHCKYSYLDIKPKQEPYRGWRVCSTCRKDFILNYTPAPVQEAA